MARKKKINPKKQVGSGEWTFVNNGKAGVNRAASSLLAIKPKYLEQTKTVNIGRFQAAILSDCNNETSDENKNKRCLVYTELKGEPQYAVLTEETWFIKGLLTGNFQVTVIVEDLSVYLNVDITFPLHPKVSQRYQKVIKKLMSLTLLTNAADVCYDSNIEVTSTQETMEELYGATRLLQNNLLDSIGDEDVQHPHLKPKLRPYQAQGVRWMIHREKTPALLPGSMDPSYQLIVSPDGTDIFYDRLTGDVTLEMPVISMAVTGGILADEMGLGKTVEVLACILCNPRQKQDHDLNGAKNDEKKTSITVDITPKNNNNRKKLNSLKTLHRDKLLEEFKTENQTFHNVIINKKSLNHQSSQSDTDNNLILSKIENTYDNTISHLKSPILISSDEEYIPRKSAKHVNSAAMEALPDGLEEFKTENQTFHNVIINKKSLNHQSSQSDTDNNLILSKIENTYDNTISHLKSPILISSDEEYIPRKSAKHVNSAAMEALPDGPENTSVDVIKNEEQTTSDVNKSVNKRLNDNTLPNHVKCKPIRKRPKRKAFTKRWIDSDSESSLGMHSDKYSPQMEIDDTSDVEFIPNSEKKSPKNRHKINRPKRKRIVRQILSDDSDIEDDKCTIGTKQIVEENCNSTKITNQVSGDDEKPNLNNRQDSDNRKGGINKKVINKNMFGKTPVKKISANRTAAQIWYESKLAEVNINLLRGRSCLRQRVECLCGELDAVGKEVTCIECKKIQHKICLDFDGPDDTFYCPQCWQQRPVLQTGATLIITPVSLSKQWISEIKKHVNSKHLNVLIYRGIHKTGYFYPTKLLKYDIVLTTYNILQSELKYIGNEELDRGLRFIKKYNAPTSPLLCLEWWRICLDEAQVVDSPTKLVATMAKRLSTIHRWGVSGTPAQRGIADIYGLVSFLGIKPYEDQVVWNNLLYIPYCNGNQEPLCSFLAKILWRTTKVSIEDQINIPKQTEIIHWAKFSAVEEFFYKREHELCFSKFTQRLQRFPSVNITLRSIERRSLNNLLAPLLSIRQVCTHPRAVRGRYLTNKKQVMSIDDLLEALIAKNLVECADSLRANICALNGMAGIHMIRDEWNAAAESYRDVLRLIEQHQDRITVDKLPHLHTLHNLAELLDAKYPGASIPPTLRDDNLRAQASELEIKYLEKHVENLVTIQTEYQQNIETAKKVQSKCSVQISSWLPDLVEWLGTLNVTDELLTRVSAALQNHSEKPTLVDSLTSGWTLIYQITTWWDKVIQNIDSLRTCFENLLSKLDQNMFSKEQMLDAVNCHLRPAEDQINHPTENKCFLCKAERTMLEYECLIFLKSTKKTKTKRKKLSKTEDAMVGTWHACEQEIAMKAVWSFGRVKRGDKECLEMAEAHLELCEALKKEFKVMRRVWTYYRDLLAAQDELSMCKERLRLRLPHEILNSPRALMVLRNLDYNIENKLEHINIIDENMIEIQFTILESTKNAYTADFTKKLGTLAYLTTLRKRSYSGMKPDPCPICTNLLEDNWSVLSCGHSYCLECIHQVLESYSSGSMLTCSICRQQQHVADISYVELKSDNIIDRPDIDFQGSFSTKVESVLVCVLKLLQEDQNVKILIFSAWEKVLSVIGDAFSSNNVSFLHMKSTGSDHLQKFKNNKEISVLLLPIHLGAKGLNIIEATHVFLVEPMLNPGEELQAIGRIHRIGQTKPTFVHRFLIKNSIEESIHNAVSENTKDWDRDRVTLFRIQNLFSTALPRANAAT